jgi:glycosyltransferase involved in cell wall biosynthesis
MVVIAFASSPRPRRFTQHAHFYLLPLLPVSVLRYAEMFLFTPLLVLWLIIRHGVQVIIAQSPYEGAVGALAKQIAHLLGKRVALIIESHGDFETVVFSQRAIALSGLYRRFMKRTAQYAFRHADLLRPVSSVTEAQMRRYAPHIPLQRFMAWTDSTAFSQTPRSKTLSETHDIIYAGVLIPLKGLHFLIDAFARLASDFPDACLWLVGKPENQDYAVQLEAQVQERRLANRVHFVGAVLQPELAAYMGRSRVLVLPSSSEGTPRVVLEAMLCGMPVIASRVGGIPDMIQEGVNGYLLPPGDVDSLATRLADVLRDPQIELMGQRARAFADSLFSEQAYVEGYRRLLETVVPIKSVT